MDPALPIDRHSVPSQREARDGDGHYRVADPGWYNGRRLMELDTLGVLQQLGVVLLPEQVASSSCVSPGCASVAATPIRVWNDGTVVGIPSGSWECRRITAGQTE